MSTIKNIFRLLKLQCIKIMQKSNLQVNKAYKVYHKACQVKNIFIDYILKT